MDLYHPNGFLLQLVPFAILSMGLGLQAFLLARDKGRNVVLWTVLGLIPLVNFFCMWFFVGASNRNLEKKIDQLLEERGRR
jgi:hypothetical protein